MLDLQLLQQVQVVGADGADGPQWQWVSVEGGGSDLSLGEDWAIFSGEVLSVITGNVIPSVFHRVVTTADEAAEAVADGVRYYIDHLH